MDMKKLALGTLVGGVVYFLLGGLIYEFLLAGFLEANAGAATGVMRETPLWGPLVFSQFTLGALVTFVLLLAKVDTLAGGLKTGAAFGLLLGLSISFDMYSVTNWLNLTAASVDPLAWMVRISLGAGAIGSVLGMGAKSAD
jgi:hypothetical protein